jgi:mannose-1-phosphate guanylyltransferase
MQREFERHQVDIWGGAQTAIGGAVCDLDFLRLAQQAVRQSPKLSIARAIMEKDRSGAKDRVRAGGSGKLERYLRA